MPRWTLSARLSEFSVTPSAWDAGWVFNEAGYPLPAGLCLDTPGPAAYSLGVTTVTCPEMLIRAEEPSRRPPKYQCWCGYDV